MNRICPRFNGIAIERTERLILRLGCNQWQCQVCSARLQDSWRHHLMRKISELGCFWSFHTITMPSFIHKASTEELRCLWSLKRIRSHWDKFMKWMKRTWGKFEYVRVFETHEDATMHIHFLASFHVAEDDYKTANEGTDNAYTYSRTMKDNVSGYGWGWMTSSINLPVDDFALTVGYVTKYMTKEDDFVTKYIKQERVRRIQTSRKIGALPKNKSDGNWEIGAGVNIYEHKQAPFYDLDLKRKTSDKDFLYTHWYPKT